MKQYYVDVLTTYIVEVPDDADIAEQLAPGCYIDGSEPIGFETDDAFYEAEPQDAVIRSLISVEAADAAAAARSAARSAAAKKAAATRAANRLTLSSQS